MGVVAVGTNRGIAISGIQQLGVHAVRQRLELVGMALLAGIFVLQGVAAAILGRICRVRITGNIGVAGLADQIGVSGVIEGGWVHRNAQQLAVWQGEALTWFTVAAQADAVIGFLSRRGAGRISPGSTG